MSNEISIGKDKYWFSQFTGVAKGVRRWTESTVSGSGSSGGGTYHGTGAGGGSVSISTTHTEYCEFFLTDGTKEQRFRVSGFYKAFLDGHKLTAFWMGRQGKDSGSTVYIYNHMTDEGEFEAGALDALLGSTRPAVVLKLEKLIFYGGWLAFVGIGAGVALGYGVYSVIHSGFFATVFGLGAWAGPPAWLYFWTKRRDSERRAALISEILRRFKGA